MALDVRTIILSGNSMNQSTEKYNGSPETVIIFSSYGREEVSLQSLASLQKATMLRREDIKIIVSDATPNCEKIEKIRALGIEDIIWTPGFTSAATSRNIAVEYMLDKYAPEYICFVEDDILYSDKWYETIVQTTKKYYGSKSPFGLSYGMFTCMSKRLLPERVMLDEDKNLLAYMFGAVADQRFMPLRHYLAILRMWDPDILGISYCQTGMQTSRNTMRGYCGGVIVNDKLCWLIDDAISTWTTKRDPGPQAHDFNISKFDIVCQTAKSKYFSTQKII